eukprot:COSAG01_NODE_5819_length_4014_cov_5.567561_2_plen_383_part_00
MADGGVPPSPRPSTPGGKRRRSDASDPTHSTPDSHPGTFGPSGTWRVAGFIRVPDGTQVKLRRNPWQGVQSTPARTVFTRPEWQARAGQSLVDICLGDPVDVVHLSLEACPSAVAIVAHRPDLPEPLAATSVQPSVPDKSPSMPGKSLLSVLSPSAWSAEPPIVPVRIQASSDHRTASGYFNNYMSMPASSRTTAATMVAAWENEFGPCSRRITVGRDEAERKLCYDDKRHYEQAALSADTGNPDGNYLSIYIRFLRGDGGRVVCFDFDGCCPARPSGAGDEFASCALFQRLLRDGCLTGKSLHGCKCSHHSVLLRATPSSVGRYIASANNARRRLDARVGAGVVFGGERSSRLREGDVNAIPQAIHPRVCGAAVRRRSPQR